MNKNILKLICKFKNYFIYLSIKKNLFLINSVFFNLACVIYDRQIELEGNKISMNSNPLNFLWNITTSGCLLILEDGII